MDELLKVQSQIRNQAQRGRFVARENLHLTLQFLGDVPAQKSGPIVQALHRTAQCHSTFSLALKHVGSFRNGHSFRVVWIGIDGDIQNLARLQKDLAVSLAGLGFPEETRPYQPHITLGRDVEFDGEASFGKYSHAMEKLPFPVSRVSLIESTVENGKRIYRSLYSFPLGSNETGPAGITIR